MVSTEYVRSNRELWFRVVQGSREAYRDDFYTRTTIDSVDAALSMADRAMAELGVPDDVRATVLHYAIFKSDTGGIDEIRQRVLALATPAPKEG